MKTYKFVVKTGYPGCDHETEEAFDDNVTEEELLAYLREFIFENCNGYWKEIEDDAS